MSIQTTAADFAEGIVQSVHDQFHHWFETIEPECQAEARDAYAKAVSTFEGTASDAALWAIHQMSDAYFSMAVTLYAAGVRHGAAAEQFRAALTTSVKA